MTSAANRADFIAINTPSIIPEAINLPRTSCPKTESSGVLIKAKICSQKTKQTQKAIKSTLMLIISLLRKSSMWGFKSSSISNYPFLVLAYGVNLAPHLEL